MGKIIKRLAGCVREYKGLSIATLLLMVGEAAIESIIPYITGEKLINFIQTSNGNVEMSYIIKIGILMAVMAVFSLAFGGFAGLTAAKASAGFAKNLRHDLFQKVQGFTFHNIDKFSSASLVTRMTSDVTNVRMSYMMLIRTAVRCPLMLIFSIIMAAKACGWMSLTFVVVIPILVVGFFVIFNHAMPAFRRVFKKYDRLNESIEENVRGMRVVKGFSREEYEKKKFANAADAICEDFTKAERIVAWNTPLMNFCMYFNMIFTLIVGSWLAIAKPQTGVNVGQLSMMLTYGMQVLMSLMMFSMIFVIVTISVESAKRIYEVLEEEPDIKNPEAPAKEVADGSIEFEKVSFRYTADAQVFALSDISLKIPSGATVGILGGTGSSKSTLVQLIPRLYDATEGIVRVGGKDVKDYDTATLRESVAMVLQKNLLFSGTIKENLRWGNENATDEELEQACKLAQADGFIQSFPEGYDTYIEQGGTNVSGGQKQRLCIARALLKKPKILILDDSTSAVDTKTDAFIRAGFRSYIPETTKIIIAQRVASVQDADMIIVMENGKIASVGTHEELMEKSTIYREIYEQQTNGNGGDEQ